MNENLHKLAEAYTDFAERRVEAAEKQQQMQMLNQELINITQRASDAMFVLTGAVLDALESDAIAMIQNDTFLPMVFDVIMHETLGELVHQSFQNGFPETSAVGGSVVVESINETLQQLGLHLSVSGISNGKAYVQIDVLASKVIDKTNNVDYDSPIMQFLENLHRFMKRAHASNMSFPVNLCFTKSFGSKPVFAVSPNNAGVWVSASIIQFGTEAEFDEIDELVEGLQKYL